MVGQQTGLRGRYRAYAEGGTDESAPWQALFALFHVTTSTGSKFLADRCFAHAASLSYASLVALVPMSVLAFTFFTAFERYTELRTRMEEAIFLYFVPSVGEQLLAVLDQVTHNIQRLSLPGLLLFLFSSTILLNSLEASFNAVWGIRRSRSYVMKMVISWSVLTLVPVLLASGTVLADQFHAHRHLEGWLTAGLTFLFTWAAFFLMLHIIPNTRTRPLPSLAGGLFGASLWLGSRSLFSFYVLHVASVQAALGSALAAIALFLLWVYFSWGVVLLSAQIAYAIQHPRPASAHDEAEGVASFRAFYNALVLMEICRRYKEGSAEATDPGVLAQAIGTTPEVTRFHIEDLIEAGLICRTDGGGFVPSQPPANLDLAEVLRRRGRHLLGTPRELHGATAERVAQLFAEASTRGLASLAGHDLESLLAWETDRE